MMIVINRTTTLLALFALPLTVAPSTAFGHETGSLEKRLVESLPGIQQETQSETRPDAQESKRGKRKKTQPQNADQPVEPATPAPDSETQTAPAKLDTPRRQKPAKLSRRLAESAATPSPSPPVELSTTPSPEPTVDAMMQSAPAPSATPSLTASSTSALKPPGGNSILSLPVVLGLFALALIALIVTVLMLMKQLRGTSKPGT